MKTALITGITGQDGAFLAQLLLNKGYRVIGAARRSASGSLWRLKKLRIENDVEIVDMELTEQSNVEEVIREYKPDELYNLAAMSFVGTSFKQPVSTMNINTLGVAYLLEAIRRHCPATKFYQASTSEMFGGLVSPQNELTPFHPRSPYGVAKLAAHWLTVNYRESYNLHASCGILFNHESELRGSEFVTKKIVEYIGNYKRLIDKKEIVRIKPLELGNIYSKRDWGYAKDYVEAMWLMLQQNTADDYVIATGETHTVKEFVNFAFATIGVELSWIGEDMDETAIDVENGNMVVKISEKFYRPAEVEVLLGVPAKAKEKLKWECKTNFPKLVSIMVNNELNRLVI